jgi:type IV secretion system protein VirD4
VWDNNGGVYFGYATDRTEGPPPVTAPVIQYVGDRHLMTVGPAGSGVMQRLLQPNVLALRDWSMVVVDTSGELTSEAMRRRDPEMRQTIVLNPFEAGGVPGRGFDPVAALDPQSPDFPDDALDLAEALIRHDGAAAASSQDLLTALIMYARLDGGGLLQVRECLGQDRDGFRGVVERLMAAGREPGWPELAIKAARFAGMEAEDRELNRVLACALTQTRWLDSRRLRKDLTRHEPIDFSMLKEMPTAVFLILPARRLGTHAAWLRAIIASILQVLMRDGTPSKVPVMLMLDEYPAIARGGFPAVEGNMAALAAGGIKLWTVWHDLGRAKELYGGGFESFVAHCGVLQAFAPQDVVTAEYLSQRTGLTALEMEAMSRTVNLGPGKTSSQTHAATTSFQPVPRMLPQDLRNMQEGFSVIFSHKVRNTVRAFMPLPTPQARRRSFLGLVR